MDLVGPLISIGMKVPGVARWCFVWRVKQNIAALMFWRDGFRSVLEKISQGNGTSADLEDIARILRTTQTDVENAATFLKHNRARIASTIAPAEAQFIDELCYRKMGPLKIRGQLSKIVEQRNLSATTSQQVLQEIDEFTRIIEKLRS